MSSSPTFEDDQYETITTVVAKKPATRTTANQRKVPVEMMGNPDNALAAANPLSEAVLAVSPELRPMLISAVEQFAALKARNAVPAYGSTTIYPFQYAVAGTFARSQGITKLFMEKATGKTITAFEAAMQSVKDGGVCLIAVPEQALPTWRGQGYESGLLDKDISKNKIFIFNPADKVQYAYLTSPGNRAILQRRARITGLILVAKDSSVVAKGSAYPGAMTILSAVGKDLPLTIIVDEGHTPKRQVDIVIGKGVVGKLSVPPSSDDLGKIPHGMNIIRVLYMAGSVIRLATDHSIHCYLKPRTPIAKWVIEALPEDPNEAEILKKQMYRDIFAQYRHVIVSSEEDEWISIKELVPASDRNSKRRNHNTYNIIGPGVSNPEAAFADDSSKTVYHLSTKKGKGLNLLADVLVIDSTAHRQIDSLIQLSGRPLRPNNMREEVMIIVFTRKQDEYYKAYYASAFSYNAWTMGYDETANAQFVSKALVGTRLLGRLPSDLGSVDRCTVLANYVGMEVSNEDDTPGMSRVDRLTVYMRRWRQENLAKLGETTIFSNEYEGYDEEYYK